MADLTKTAMAKLVLSKLGRVPVGQDAHGQEAGVALAAIDRCHAELGQMGLAPWSVDATPQSVASAFALYVASELFAELPSAEFTPDRFGALRMLTASVLVRDNSDQPVRIEAF